MFSDQILELSTKVQILAQEQNTHIATAESCTGGLIAAALTEIAGSSCFFDRGFVTYSNEAKTEMINVPKDMIQQFGAVSDEVAQAMAIGTFENSNATLTVTTTGIAGPGGATEGKPVGLVHFGLCHNGHPHSEKKIFDGNRAEIREQSVAHALNMLINTLS